jgi:hypothetical protein
MNARRLMHDVLDSPWGRLFRNWENLTSTADGFPQVGSDAAQIEKTGLNALKESFGILATCVKEAPEFASRRRHAKGA